ncbi:MAG: sulfatase-like hydrolase/transferase [Luteitalea sp.]|nr:sulfatase-like hydrolase/transferase [Luteitalea sp.]
MSAVRAHTVRGMCCLSVSLLCLVQMQSAVATVQGAVMDQAKAVDPGAELQRRSGLDRQNVVLILTDNHGPWTLGAYGNEDIPTPHIDRLAREGILFTRAFANNPVCSPTRATLLTGLMPSQHGVHRYLGRGGAQVGPGAYNTIEEFDSLPSILAAAGYVTGLVGKWHLGDNLNPQEGFTYWVTKPEGGSAGFYDQEVVEGGEIRVEPSYLTDFWTDHGVRFIEESKNRPFFLYLAYNGPYGLGRAMEEEPIRNRHAARFADHPLPSMPRDAPHPWNYNYGDWMDNMQVRRKYAAEVSGIDDGVGRILEALRRMGLEQDTLVIFTGDQGLSGGHSGFWGMGDHTRPLTAFDWTFSIPLILRHPDEIPPNRRSDLLVSNYDLFPTLLSYLGLESRIPSGGLPAPGRNLENVLKGAGSVAWDNEVYFEFENVRAIRTEEWKYIERAHQKPNELYNLQSDRGERLNRYEDPETSAVRARLQEKLSAFFGRYTDPKWDLWKGGRSKSDLITGDLFGIRPGQEGRRD